LAASRICLLGHPTDWSASQLDRWAVHRERYAAKLG
jgi:hypothetical protein